MGSGRALAPMRKINSETNLAVQLLLAVSDARSHPHHQPQQQQQKQTSPTSTILFDARADSSCDSDATDAVTPSLTSPALPHNVSEPIMSSSPRTTAVLAKRDSVFFKYTREERLEALQRFREKKRRRQFQKRVRYMVRKRLAETRPRYKGRFSKPPPGENYDDGTPGPPLETSQESKTQSVAVKQ